MNTTIVLDRSAGPLVAMGSYGVGDDARRLQDLLQQAVDRLTSSVSLGRKLQGAVRELNCVFEECSVSDWDGYGAQPVSPESYGKAKQFIEALPWGFPLPEISADPDGEISFEWYSSPSKIFSVSVSPNNELSYAGLFGARRTHGTEVFHDEIPEILLSHIKRVIS